MTFLLRTTTVAVVLVLAACSHRGVGPGTSFSSLGWVAPSPLPTVAASGPLSLADCGWPPGTAIAYQGWSTEADLGLVPASSHAERMFWLVTAERVELMTSMGPRMTRVACSVGRQGFVGWRVVPDDWRPPARE